MKQINKYCYQVTEEGQGAGIIEILKELGGENYWGYNGKNVSKGSYYLIRKNNNWIDCKGSDSLDINDVKSEKITSYKLIRPEYEQLALSIANLGIHPEAVISKDDLYNLENSPKFNISIPNLQKAGVLDLWFEQVYEEIVNLPEINGHKGEISAVGKVRYGCQSFEFGYVKTLVESVIEPYSISGNMTMNGHVISTNDIQKVYNELKRLNKI